MTHDDALKILLDEIDMQKEVYQDHVETDLIDAMKFACSCILRDMREAKKK